MFVKLITSRFLYIKIQIHRVIEHAWLKFVGLPMNRHSLITPNIYLGGQYAIKNIPALKKRGVTAIVNMRERSIYTKNFVSDIPMLHLPTVDNTAPTMNNLKKGVVFIDEAIKKGGKAYIHCKLGEGRGPTMTIAYLIYSGMTFADAFTLVKKVRPFINPVPAQIERLKEFEKLIASEKSAKKS